MKDDTDKVFQEFVERELPQQIAAFNRMADALEMMIVLEIIARPEHFSINQRHAAQEKFRDYALSVTKKKG